MVALLTILTHCANRTLCVLCAFLQPSTGLLAPSLVPLRTTSPCAPRVAPTAASQAHALPLPRLAHPHGPQSTSSHMTPSALTHPHPRTRRRVAGAGCHKVSETRLSPPMITTYRVWYLVLNPGPELPQHVLPYKHCQLVTLYQRASAH